ncbi:uncharacterized protein N7482_004749 [Penicillium canariense]|uniref:CRIB domain-containing protein n=1 Tax=Penicillium canariense TaxID=189055 RepID=A0A9W9I766_9EURO|nr:uncharacterized protein N7482_004749 [Penicillium canariense]KAJ5169155.1 hypothetical protein N7482_004749 [Penicillium canariense]
MSTFSRLPSHWDDDQSVHSDPPSTGSSNDPPEHIAHFRSRSTAHAQSPKRLSVFSGRSRSNTTTSTSSRPSPGSSMTSTDSSVPSQDERAFSALGMRPDKPERLSRSFLARGSRILRRQGSKINIVATLDEEDEMEKQPRPAKQDILGRHRNRHVDHHERLKSIISDPFDFHHLTHTSPSQFQSLDQTRENDLVTEFSVIRASQRPEASLKGIRAEDIHFRNFSNDDLASLGTATTVNEPVPRSPPGSPAASGSVMPSGNHARRESRIYENFSRPVSRYPRSCPTTPPSPVVPEVPAEGVEPAPRAIDEILGLDSALTYPEYIDSERSSSSHLQFGPDLADDPTARTSSMSSHYDLEDVPEEDEATRLWDSPEPSIDGARSRSTSQMSPGTVEARPASRMIAPKAPLSIFVAEELSRKFSEALGSPTLPQNLPNALPQEAADITHRETTPPSVSRVRQFSYDDELYDSWDADIDYCYEHAAESTSNFDWSRTSLEEAGPQTGVACTDESWGLSVVPSKPARHLQPSPLSTSTLATPDLDPSSARSALPHSAATPSTEYERAFIARGAQDYFHPVSSSILSKHLTQDSLYEDYLSGDADADADASSDRHFPFAPAYHNPSPRSSFSPISKCNSQESLMLSRAASIVRKHRSSVSTTSVPELVHSLSSSRELMPTDRLSAAEILARPTSSSLHRQTKSLAEAHQLMHTGSSASLASAETAPPGPVHDRANSTSEVEGGACASANVSAALPAVPTRNPNRKKTRTTSYSLFPTAAQ